MEKDSNKTKMSDADLLKLAASTFGRMGGLKGGRARAEKLTPEERTEIARNAAILRWEKNKRNK